MKERVKTVVMAAAMGAACLFLSPGGAARGEILPAQRRIVWQPGVPGGLPARDAACPASAPSVRDFGAAGDGNTDDTQAFRHAIQAAAPGTAIRVPAGDYLLQDKLRIDKGIVLCGEGPDVSRLLFDADAVGIEIVKYDRGQFVDVLSGATKDSSRIRVTDASSFSAGDFAELRQENDWDLLDPDDHWRHPDQVGWVPDHVVGQMFLVVDVQGDTLVVDPPVHMDFDPAQNPQIRRMGLVVGAGLQGLYFERLSGDHATILLKNAAYCWIRDCESAYTWRAHVSSEAAFRCEIRHNYFHHAYDYGGGGHGYGVTLGQHVTDFLVEDNIFVHLRHAMMVHIGANGNVFGYNFSIEREADGNWTPCDISLHGHYAFMNLFEGNVVREVDVSDYWGTTGPGNTFLRNRVLEEGIEVRDYSSGQNIVGNELGSGDNVILVQNSVSDTLIHGNLVEGHVQWDPSIPDHDIPASYYHASRPAFFGCTPWPAMGSDVAAEETKIPAEQRYTGEMVECDGGPPGQDGGTVEVDGGPTESDGGHGAGDAAARSDGATADGAVTPDGGTGSSGSSGCSCRSSAPAQAPLLLVLAGWAALVFTRKRRRRR